MIKRFLFFLVALYATSHFCQKATDGFAMAKVSTFLLDEPTPSVELPATTYRYLGKGGQSYIFVSEDDRYVLKLFRSSRLNNLKLFYTVFPTRALQTKIDAQEELMKQTLKSYSIANQYLKDETGLIGIHLGQDSNFDTPLTLVDKLGINHTLNPNDYPFVIQEKAILVKEKIAQLMESGKLLEARLALTHLFALIEARQEMGIADGDPNLMKNFGFCGDRPIQIDGGRFSLLPLPPNDKFNQSKEELQNWIHLHYPEL